MKQVVILSGKGGTGKTTVTAAFAHLAAGDPATRVALVDADVDASNLELVLVPLVHEAHDFVGGQVAVIDAALCAGCGQCADVCRFEAIMPAGDRYDVDEVACEGCAACATQCPHKAIHMEPQVAGRWFRSESRYGALFHAALRPGQENSGKLVTLIRQQALSWVKEMGCPLVLIDGPPGIGCPVIAAATGVDLAVIVAEPTAAGIHDLERALQTTRHFNVPSLVCINKADLYPAGQAEIERFCSADAIRLIGSVPFDTVVTRAMVQGEPVTAYDPGGAVSRALHSAWGAVLDALDQRGKTRLVMIR